MVFSMLAPTIATFCVEDWYKQVAMSLNEEEQHDQSHEHLKKINEKDLFVYELPSPSFSFYKSLVHYYVYHISEGILNFEITLPPPEHTA